LVTAKIHFGAQVRIGRLATDFSEDVRGPVRIEARMVEGVPELVAIDPRTEALSILPSFQPRDLVREAGVSQDSSSFQH
jgi:hypothetical protein